MKILLVDDEIEFVSTLAERLAIRGMDADYATSPEEALKIIEKKSYDLAILDIKMPQIGGIRLKKILNEKIPAMKFIFLTGHGSEKEFKEGVSEAGEENYLLKPVRFEDLIEKIEAIKSKISNGAY